MVISRGFCIYRIFWRRSHAEIGLEGPTTHQGTPERGGVPWCLVATSFPFWSNHVAPRVFLFQKNRQKLSLYLENFDFCTKNNTTVVLLKTTSVRVSFIQIMQVRVQNKGKSVWKSRYVGDVSTFDVETVHNGD